MRFDEWLLTQSYRSDSIGRLATSFMIERNARPGGLTCRTPAQLTSYMKDRHPTLVRDLTEAIWAAEGEWLRSHMAMD